MFLKSPQSATLSALIFNAVVIVTLIPLALNGVKLRSGDAAETLARNLAIYGVGGVLGPFLGIKMIDLIITTIGLVR